MLRLTSRQVGYLCFVGFLERCSALRLSNLLHLGRVFRDGWQRQGLQPVYGGSSLAKSLPP